MQILAIFMGFGLTPKGKIMKPAHFVFQSYWVVPLTCKSFIENGEMAHDVSPLPGPLVNSVLKALQTTP